MFILGILIAIVPPAIVSKWLSKLLGLEFMAAQGIELQLGSF